MHCWEGSRAGGIVKRQGTQRPIIVRYLNYADRFNILRSFWNFKSLQLDSHKLLLFEDYSQEVSHRSKEFQPICAALYKNKIKFTLAYPAILRFTDPSDNSKSFSHPEEAMHFLQAYLHTPVDTSAPSTPSRLPEPRDQRSPKNDPAKKLCLTDFYGGNEKLWKK